MSHKISRDPLTIRLTESVVFLRGAAEAASGRRRHEASNGPPAMLRGLLTLQLSKPTRVSSIELELEGKSVVQWPEGTGQRRIDVPDEHKFLSARTVFFSAKACPLSTRSASLGPGSRTVHDDEEHNTNVYRSTPSHTPSRPSFETTRPSMVALTPPPTHERRNSADQYGWQRHTEGPENSATLSTNFSTTPPISPPYTPEPVHSSLYAEVPVSRPQTPDSRPGTSFWQRSKGSKSEENPGQMLEEFRNALRMEMNGAIGSMSSRTASSHSLHTLDPTSTTSESSPLGLGLILRSESAPGSRSSSRDTEHRQTRPATPLHNIATSTAPNSSAPTVRSTTPTFRSPVSFEYDHESTNPNSITRERKAKRWSLSNMSSVLKDRMGGGSPKEPEFRRGRTLERYLVNGNNNDHHADPVFTQEERERKRKDRERKSTLSKLTAAVSLDESANVDGWKEFRKGTYTYPISFSIPSTAPPTLHCDFGSVSYRLKAVVHRPGALTAKIATMREVTLVASPAEDDSEETHSIVVERQWDNQLRYLISLGGRSFSIGSQVPFNLTMVPLEKCKVYRLSVFLEEKTEYYGRSRHVTRELPIQRFELLSIRHTEKNPPPILPLSPESASLLIPYLDATSFTDSADEALSSLMGPGPWVLAHNLQLPIQCGRIHFTYKQKGVNIAVSHTLKIVFRVERGDDQCIDAKTRKRRLFDIVVQTPIYILSCHCKLERIALPRYSLFATDNGQSDSHSLSCACSGGSIQPTASFRQHTSPAATPSNSRPSTPHGPSAQNNINNALGHTEGVSPPPDLADASYQFARLVSGQESVLGEAPPGYHEISGRREYIC